MTHDCITIVKENISCIAQIYLDFNFVFACEIYLKTIYLIQRDKIFIIKNNY
jgi:hypothetical protein